MASEKKKNPTRGTTTTAARKKKKENPRNKYFWKKEVYIGSIPSVFAEMKKSLAVMQMSNLRLLDQKSMSQETFINACWIYVAQKVASMKLGEMENEMRPAFEELAGLVAEAVKERDGIETPEGKGG